MDTKRNTGGAPLTPFSSPWIPLPQFLAYVSEETVLVEAVFVETTQMETTQVENTQLETTLVEIAQVGTMQ